MIDALVFDFDGLILDTETAVFESWRRTWEHHGHELPLDRWHQAIGTDGSGFDPHRELEARVGRNFAEDELHGPRRAIRDEILGAKGPMPGIAELLDSAAERGLGRAVASSSPREWVEPHLERLGLIAHFDTVVTRDDVTHAKPRPDLYLEAVARLDVAAHLALAFEDSPNGVDAAKAAGLHCVAVPCSITRTLSFDAADLRIHSLGDHTLDTLLAELF
jgi:HAD superfamily hydrolase (TIGR01509 family)